jgi:hypothetical protein
MSSKKKDALNFYPTPEMYHAQSECFKNEIYAYIVPAREKCFVELNYKGNVKKGKEILDSQVEASMVIWKLYEHIYENQIKFL